MNEKVKSMLKAVGYLLLTIVVQFVIAMSVMIFIIAKNAKLLINTSTQGFAVDILLSDYMKKISLIMLIYAVMTILIVTLIFKVRKNKAFKEFGLNKFSRNNNLLAIGIGVTGWLLISVFLKFLDSGGVLQSSFEKLSEASKGLMSSNILVNIFVVGIVVPFAEEFVFRGAILRTLKKGMKVKYAIIIQAILFGIAHGNFVQFIFTVFIGCILGYVAHKCKSIWPAIAIHITNNVLSTVATVQLDALLRNVYIAVTVLIFAVIGLVIGIKALNKSVVECEEVEIIMK